MSLIIKKFLFEKLAKDSEWQRFMETFQVLCGRQVTLLESWPDESATALNVKVDVRGMVIAVMTVEADGMGEARANACRYLLAMAAERFVSILAQSSAHDHENLPAAVLRTTRWVRSRALEHDVRLADAAAACGLSPSHLSRLFHYSTGLTFQEYVRRFRLEHSCELLATTNESVTAIAFESGFQSISQFHRSFRAVYGEPPLAYRKRHGGV